MKHLKENRQRLHDWRLTHPEMEKVYRKTFIKNHPDHYRKITLKKYDLTKEQYQFMYDGQHGCCAMCGTWFPVLCVDHDHDKNMIRGLLCDRCNVALGYIEKYLKVAKAYLRSADSNRVMRRGKRNVL